MMCFSGWLFSQLMQYTERKGFIDRESYIAQYIALTLFTIGIARTIGSDDLLAAFAAGACTSRTTDLEVLALTWHRKCHLLGWTF